MKSDIPTAKPWPPPPPWQRVIQIAESEVGMPSVPTGAVDWWAAALVDHPERAAMWLRLAGAGATPGEVFAILEGSRWAWRIADPRGEPLPKVKPGHLVLVAERLGVVLDVGLGGTLTVVLAGDVAERLVISKSEATGFAEVKL